MKPIFISYSSKHRDLTRQLAAALEAQYGAGSVWWDHELESWGDYEVQIRNALNEARVVVVIWTKAAGESDWVKSEAGRANRTGKLVNVRPQDTVWADVPSPYDQHHVNALEDIPGILKSIQTVWEGKPIRTAVPLHEIYFRHHGQRLIDPKQQALPAGIGKSAPPSFCRRNSRSSTIPTPPACGPPCSNGVRTQSEGRRGGSFMGPGVSARRAS